MRIRTLRLLAFGSFTGRELTLRGNGVPEDALVVAYGANEAGKSTTLRAIGGLLFGIPAQTRDAHLHRMQDLRVGGVLEAADGSVVEIVRRKGVKNTLLDESGNPIDEAVLRRMCGATTEATFRALFGLDHVSLREGAEALLAGRGDVGESLFDAARGGGRAIRRVLADLEAEADALFTPQAQKRKLNEAIRAVQDARSESRLRARSGEAWLKQRHALEEAKKDPARIVDIVRARKRELSSLERARRLLPIAARRARTREQIAALGEVALLPVDATKTREATMVELREAEAEITRLDDEIADALERRSGLAEPRWLDDPATSRLEGLSDRIGAYRQAAEDRPRLEGRLTALAAELREMGERAGLGAALHELPAPGAAAQARIRELAMQDAAVVQRRDAARRALEDIERRRRAPAEALAALPPRDAGPIRATLRRIERSGDLGAALEAAIAEKQAIAVQLERQLGALSLVRLVLSDPETTAGAVLAFGVPTAESVDHAAADFQRLATLDDRVRDEIATLERRRLEVERKRAELESAGQVPSVEAVRKARSERDEAWRRLRNAWTAAESASAARETREALETRFEQANARADDAADRLWRDADRAARAATLAPERDEIVHLRELAEAERREILREREARFESWRALWRPAGIEPDAPVEMRGWLRRFGETVELGRRLENAASEAAALDAKLRRARDEIEAALGATGTRPPAEQSLDPTRHPPSGESGDLALGRRISSADFLALVDSATSTLQAIEAETRRREQIASELAALDEARERAAREFDDAGAALADWRQRWAVAVEPLGLGANASAVEASALLDATGALAHARAQETELRRRLAGIDRDRERFAGDIGALATALAPDLAERPAEDAAEQLLARHREAVEARRDRRRIDEEVLRRRESRKRAETRHAAATSRLAELVRAAGVADVESLERAEERSGEARELARRLAEQEDQILASADGFGLEAALAEVAGVSADELDLRIDSLREELEERESELQRANQTIGSLAAGLRVLEEAEGAGAAEAAEEAQAHVARVRALAEQYARLRLGARLLAREVERYRDRHQGPVLARAGALLSRLTLARYTGLRADFDESDRPVLRCVRADESRVTVDGLSDGTRDQLYLALRLATLEHHASAGEPLPLLLDDVLIHFDDGRAAAALDVLADHARRTQVVLFTHHARIVDLAASVLPSGRVHVLRLDG